VRLGSGYRSLVVLVAMGGCQVAPEGCRQLRVGGVSAPIQRPGSGRTLGNSPRAVLDQRTHALGTELGATAHASTGDSDTQNTARWGSSRHTATNRAPKTTPSSSRTARSTPWHRNTTELVCGTNLHLLPGLLDSLAPTGLTALLRPSTVPTPASSHPKPHPRQPLIQRLHSLRVLPRLHAATGSLHLFPQPY
jgi:hypothetical protein